MLSKNVIYLLLVHYLQLFGSYLLPLLVFYCLQLRLLFICNMVFHYIRSEDQPKDFNGI